MRQEKYRKLLKEIIVFLKNPSLIIRFKKLRAYYAETYVKRDYIYINIDLRKAEILDNLIHEVLHNVRPQWSEKKVRRETNILVKKKISQKKLAHLLALLIVKFRRTNNFNKGKQ